MRGADLETLQGTVDRITFYNPQNGFSVIRVRIRGRREPVAVVGTMPAVQPGESLILEGGWNTDPRHGAQFQPSSVSVTPPSDADAIARYLGSGLVRFIGPVLAKRIVSVFGTQTLEVLDQSPDRVREVPGIGRQRAEAISRAWAEHRALRGIIAFLTEHGLDTRYAGRLLKAYGADAPRILAANPYRLVAEVPGLGFAAADRIGQTIDVRSVSPARLQAAVIASVLRAAENGHTRMTRGDLVMDAAEVAGVDVAHIEAAITQQIAAEKIIFSVSDVKLDATESATLLTPPTTNQLPEAVSSQKGRLRIYEPAPQAVAQAETVGLGLTGLVTAEEDLAARIKSLITRRGLPERQVEHALAAEPKAVSLSDEQRTAVRAAATCGMFVLTGGPGVGKTTTVRALVSVLTGLERSVALAAPTGKAAKRLGDVVGMEAKTLHRLLGAGPSGFRHWPGEPLPFDVVIVDECSMLDTSLARALVRAIGPQTQLILVGDADQLPSIGAGQVLRDLLSVNMVPSCTLTTIFRQAAQSRIVTNAHRIRSGLAPELAGPAALAQGVDCIFVPASPSRVAAVGADWAGRLLPKSLGVPASDVQAVAPLTRVCQALNSTLQEQLNPARGQAERPHGALPLRVGDRVIQTRNNYDLAVFNGDTGTVADIQPDAIQVDFGDDHVVSYEAGELLDLEHAYCLTVHRAQGSEWPGVVVLASSAFGSMLSRSLLYTAITRARQAVVIVGDDAAIVRAVADVRDQNRYTGLAALLTS
ncbi:MAG: recombinase [Chloroflexi bacterium]|nr:recombinase [Chloroflexota bacterium]